MDKSWSFKKLGLLLVFTMSCAVSAQTETSGTAENRWILGGAAGLGGSFGSNGATALYLSPRVGYRITSALEAGVAADFTWSNSSYYSTTSVGVGPFLNYIIAENFFLSTLFQEHFFTEKIKPTDVKYTGEEAALYVGGGYVQRIGPNASMRIGGMYNVLYNKNKSIFSSGFVPSVSVVFGL